MARRDGDGRRRLGAGTDPGADPVETLKRRYADGDIDDAEFDARLDRLLDTPDTLAELEAERG
ncbi:SHOCT domain-containing protein [Halosegnis marinus]|uniref:SHOCT domain-containing protein n=1 Tax=Halosegnis marinus TaxID=3034023 RepID=UPI00360C9BEB